MVWLDRYLARLVVLAISFAVCCFSARFLQAFFRAALLPFASAGGLQAIQMLGLLS